MQGGGVTIIDALVVELGLDPTRFTRGQQQAVQSLRQFQTQAEQSNRAMRQSTETTVSGLRQMTSGFGTLTAAALSAWTILKTVQATLQSIVDTGAHAARAGYGASWAGTGTNMFSAVANAVFKSTGASREGTQDFMAKLARDIAGVKRGLPPTELLKTLGQLGIGWDQDPTKIMGDLADVFSKMTPAMSQSFGASLGLDPLATTALSRGRADFNKRVAEAQEIAVTEKQARAAQELAEAWRGLSQTWEALIRDLLEDSEVLRDLIKLMDEWLKELRRNPEAMQAVRIGALALAAVFGVTLVTALTRATIAMVAFGATPIVRALMGGGGFMAGLFRVLGVAGLAVGGIHAAGGFDIDPKTGRSPAMTWGDRFKRWVDDKLGFKMLPDVDNRVRGGTSTPGGTVPRGTGLGYGQLKQLALNAGYVGEESSIMAAVSMVESSGNPWAHNPRYPDDSYGITQINRLAHPDAKNAYGNPEWAMKKAFELSEGRRKRGQSPFQDWTAYTSGAYLAHLPHAAAARPEGMASQPPGSGGGTTRPYKTIAEARRAHPGEEIHEAPGGGYINENDFPYPHLPEFVDRANMGARARLANGPVNTSNTTTYGGTTTGDIYVTVPPATDVTAAGRAMTDAIRNEMTASKANSGLQ